MNKKEMILHAALELLAERGVHATPMTEIAKVAHTGMGTIYNYYPNKEVLINSIYVYIKKEEAKAFEKVDINLPIKKQFSQFYKTIILYFIDNPLHFKFMEQLQASPIITAESKKIGAEAMRSILHLMEKGQADGIIKDIPMKEILQFTSGSFFSYLDWYFSEQSVDKNAIAHQIKMVWDGIRE